MFQFEVGQRVQFNYGNSDECRDVIVYEVKGNDIVGKDKLRNDNYRRFSQERMKNVFITVSFYLGENHESRNDSESLD